MHIGKKGIGLQCEAFGVRYQFLQLATCRDASVLRFECSIPHRLCTYCLTEIYEIDSLDPQRPKCTYHQSHIFVLVMHSH